MVLSGGFAKAHVSRLTPVRLAMARLLGAPGFPLAVRIHVSSLGSRFDPPGTDARLRRLFLQNVTPRGFLDRAELILKADLRPSLRQVNVPVLVLTPEADKLIGPLAARELLEGLPHGEEEVLAGTGHLLRFTHPTRYAEAIESFLDRKGVDAPPRAALP